jgi:hypothetical protein
MVLVFDHDLAGIAEQVRAADMMHGAADLRCRAC